MCAPEEKMVTAMGISDGKTAGTDRSKLEETVQLFAYRDLGLETKYRKRRTTLPVLMFFFLAL